MQDSSQQHQYVYHVHCMICESWEAEVAAATTTKVAAVEKTDIHIVSSCICVTWVVPATAADAFTLASQRFNKLQVQQPMGHNALGISGVA